MGKKIKRNCPVCGTEYLADKTRLKWGRETTCSRKCSYELRAKQKSTSIELACPVCGKTFKKPPSLIDRVKYANVCSLECLYKGRSLNIIQREIITPYDVDRIPPDKRVCPICHQEFTCPRRSTRIYCSRRCFELSHSERMAGENNPSYIDGSSLNHPTFRGSNWNIIRRRVYARDHYICQSCGVKCISKRSASLKGNADKTIQCHHIKPYESPDDNGMDNLITLCLKCHLATHNSA